MEKAYWLTQGGIEKNLEPMYNKGVVLLNNYLINEIDKYNVVSTGVVDYGGGFYLYETTSCKVSEIGIKMGEMFPAIMKYMAENNIQASGKPFSISHKWDEENKTTMFSTCVPISERIITNGDVLTGFLKPQKTFKTILTGSYKYEVEAWETAFKNLHAENLKEKSNAEPFEVYLVGPHETPNPSKWITEIYIPIE
jgi:DNA gyrase inhibitor GyrI